MTIDTCSYIILLSWMLARCATHTTSKFTICSIRLFLSIQSPTIIKVNWACLKVERKSENAFLFVTRVNETLMKFATIFETYEAYKVWAIHFFFLSFLITHIGLLNHWLYLPIELRVAAWRLREIDSAGLFPYPSYYLNPSFLGSR